VARRALTSAALAGSLAWGVASDDSFAFLAKLFGGGPTTSISTKRPEVGLLVDAPTSLAPAIAAELRKQGDAGSIALNGEVASQTITSLKANGSDALPRLKSGGPVRWVGTRQQIKHMASELGVSGHIYYEAPRHGYTYMQSLLGRTAGASGLKGRIRLAGPADLGKLRRGDIVEISVAPGPHWRATIDWLSTELHARHLHAVPADMLLRHKA
jgi:hypothetical protein